MAQLAIDAQQLTKEFKQFRSRPGLSGALRDLFDRRHVTIRAVDGIDLRVQAGEIVGYIGANGAGKSTTIKMLTGILQPTSGLLRVNGYDPHRQREQFVRTIGVVFGQRSQLWWDIAVQESFRLLQRIYRVSDKEYQGYFLGEIAPLLGIVEFFPTPVRKLSLGQRMRCELAAALLHRPDMLFLDEPTIGLDISVKLRVRELLTSINQRFGTTILLTTHDLTDIEALCRRVVMLERGQVIYDGLLADLRRQWAGQRTVRVIFASVIDSARLERPYERVDEITYDFALAEGENLSVLLGELLAVAPVRDITVRETSMEEIVRNMYEQGAEEHRP